MLVFKPCENFLLLLPPKFFTTTTTTTNSKPHLLHLHHHHHVKLHFSPLSSSSPLSSTAPAPAPAAEEDSSTSSLTTTTTTTTTVDDLLMDSSGLSYVQAQQVIQKVPSLLRNGGTKPRSVIAYFESIGFSKTHISKIISKLPCVLASDVKKTLKPKIQLLQDIQGFSESDIADLVAMQPSILHKSVKTQIKPALELIKSFVKTDEALIKTIKHSSRFLLPSSNCRKYIELNMDVLRQHGVPDSEILYLVLSHLRVLMSTPQRFKRIVEWIVSLGGFKPETRKFVTAVVSMSQMSKATWDSKIDLLKGGLGWSDEQILDSFRRCPTFLTLSRQNLEESIGFFKESLNWDASVLSQRPIVLKFSLKKRVIPRYVVFKCLMSKEIIKEEEEEEEDTLFISMLRRNETEFLSKYVFEYHDRLPYLYEEVYKKECMLGGCED